MDITKEQLAELKAAFGYATKGEWKYRTHEFDDWGYIRSEDGGIVATSRDGGTADLNAHRAAKTDPYEPNGRFIALAHNLMPSLIAAAEEAVKEIERLSGELTKARHVMRETLWMARRYADGRNTYATGMLNRAVKVAVELGAIDNKPNGEPIFAGDLLGAHASGISEEEYQRVVAARGNVERLIVEERKAERDAASAAGRKEGLELAAEVAESYADDQDKTVKARCVARAIRALIEKENANV